MVRVVWAEGADRDLPLPSYRTDGAAAADLCVHLPLADRHRGLIIDPGEVAHLPTGLRFAIPAGWEGQVRARSSLAGRHSLILPNAPGTIDGDYRGEVMVMVMNVGGKLATLVHGERVAQLVIAPVARAVFTLADDLDDTARGAGGFGSTGPLA